MDFQLHAKDSGKHVRVVDRIAGAEAFNDFIDRDDTVTVSVNSNNDENGEVDVYAQMRNDSPEFMVYTDYEIRKNETLEIEDV